MKRTIISILLLLVSLSSQAQLRTARQEMLTYNYSGAIVLLEKAFKKGDQPVRSEAAGLLAECYRLQNNVFKAREWYGQAISLGNNDPMNWYFLAVCTRSCGDYLRAKQLFLKYDSMVPGGPKARPNAAFCDSALEWLKHEPRFEIENAKELNSPQSDFSAVFSSGQLFFASDRLYGNSGQSWGWTGYSYLRIYQSEISRHDTAWPSFSAPGATPGVFSQEFHDGPVCFNKDATEAFINRTIERNDPGRKDVALVRTHLLKIYHSKKQNGKWNKPEPFFLNSSEYSVGHPALSPDGKTLYFVSDMEGGCGGTDIWSCSRLEGRWSKPVNLGKIINTTGNEMFPFEADNGDLYFASDGHPGFGSLDIFVSVKTGDSWSLPRNMGQPVNSSWDDFSLVLMNDNHSGTFSSNRPGGAGSDDIYCFRMLPPHKQAVPPVPPALVSSPQKQLPPGLSVGKTYRIENIYYDFDKWNIRRDAEKSLDSLVKILREYPVAVEIGSHTDCRGSSEYNDLLSGKRAESVVMYLIQQGINPSRLSYKGYGKTRLINRCNCEDGVQCSEEEHQANRRTEFTITGILPDPQ